MLQLFSVRFELSSSSVPDLYIFNCVFLFCFNSYANKSWTYVAFLLQSDELNSSTGGYSP